VYPFGQVCAVTHGRRSRRVCVRYRTKDLRPSWLSISGQQRLRTRPNTIATPSNTSSNYPQCRTGRAATSTHAAPQVCARSPAVSPRGTDGVRTTRWPRGSRRCRTPSTAIAKRFDVGRCSRTPGQSRGRKATGPRLLRDACTPRRTPRPPGRRTVARRLCLVSARVVGMGRLKPA
jgi:hypothetical protein